MAQFFKDISTRGEVTIDGDGQQTRDFIYVEDLCCAIVLALESNVSGEVFQIATGVETSILELAALVQEIVAQHVEMQHGPPRQGDMRKNYSAVAKVQGMLRWEPRVDLADGLDKTYGWWTA